MTLVNMKLRSTCSNADLVRVVSIIHKEYTTGSSWNWQPTSTLLLCAGWDTWVVLLFDGFFRFQIFNKNIGILIVISFHVLLGLPLALLNRTLVMEKLRSNKEPSALFIVLLVTPFFFLTYTAGRMVWWFPLPLVVLLLCPCPRMAGSGDTRDKR